MPKRDHLPLVYSCSGCSNVAQLSNRLAVELDRADAAEMSCIAGVGGDVPSLVRVARSGRPILAIDGCVLSCVRNVLARAGVEPTVHVALNERGLRKKYQQDFDQADVDALLPELKETANAMTRPVAASPSGRRR